MSQKSGVVFRKNFDTSVDGADKAYEIEADISRMDALLMELKITKAVTDADDALDVSLEMTTDGLKWHRRIRFNAVVGNAASESAANPKYYYATINQLVALAANEEVYEGDGGVGATALVAGTVINGPFPRRRPGSAAGGARLNSARVHLVVTDPSGANADYEGSITIWDLTKDQ